MKNTWKILKEVINSKKSSASCSRFKMNDSVINDKKVIADGFNQFYINVGPNLASKIPKHDNSPTDNIILDPTQGPAYIFSGRDFLS